MEITVPISNIYMEHRLKWSTIVTNLTVKVNPSIFINQYIYLSFCIQWNSSVKRWIIKCDNCISTYLIFYHSLTVFFFLLHKSNIHGWEYECVVSTGMEFCMNDEMIFTLMWLILINSLIEWINLLRCINCWECTELLKNSVYHLENI